MAEKHPKDCPYCPVNAFTAIWTLRRHIKKQHGTLFNDYVEGRKMEQEAKLKKRAHFCQKCNKQFKTTFTHMLEKHPKDCPYCPAEFTDISNLRRHIRKYHPTLFNEYDTTVQKMRTDLHAAENTKKGFTRKCKICVKTFRCPSDVRRHELTHNTEKFFRVKYVNKVLLDLIPLYCIQNGFIKYNCKICNNSYSKSND